MTDILLAHAYFLRNDIIEQRVMKPYPPLGILYLSAYLKRVGFKRFSRSYSTRPRIVGIYANNRVSLS